ncbi:uncharacterized protein B0H18DRAFT_914203 [Fomitopsis serialis]|uniref:uncharacterized protein n=1 Tax=Fomitopsis serialis TaxID=139415 RepID=UPI0020074B8E|nr:uncharacterized protein B0H18DRAFT_914203 [Neoantrodia serialis]KAH9916526.1 hypothetical protein B0H18DRAFT_914203 [Neoantrodia serialis]
MTKAVTTIANHTGEHRTENKSMAESSVASGRPRRSTRAPIKAPFTVTEGEHSNSPGKGKAQASEKTSAEKLEYLLTNPRSKLTKLDISDILNYAIFLDLSPESQRLLVSHLPPTAFIAYSTSVPPTHVDYPSAISNDTTVAPAGEDGMDIDTQPSSSSGPFQSAQKRMPATLDPAVFTSPFFLSAAHTYQDHLFSGWFGKKAREEVTQFQSGVREGALHAEWKDEVWERDHRPQQDHSQQVDLTALAKRGLLQEGDVLSFRKHFPRLGVTVEKDILIDSINAPSSTINVLVPPRSTRSPHVTLLVNGRGEPQPQDRLQLMEDIADPVVLESGVLDIDGRVERADRGDVNDSTTRSAWKAFTVWRWRDEMRDDIQSQMVMDRGGRERVGTLFYLSTYCRTN